MKGFIITNKDDVVVDISTLECNLSRGYRFSGSKVFEVENIDGVIVEDKYEDGLFIFNQAIRDEKKARRGYELLIRAESRKIAIEKLKKEGKLPADYE